MRTHLPAVVLPALHYGALGAVRSLGRLGVPVHVVDGAPRPPAASSRYCAGHLRHALDEADPERSIDALRAYARRLGGRALLVPSNDEAAIFADRHARELGRNFLLPERRAGLVEALCDKRRMHELARFHGIPAPETRVPRRREEIVDYCRDGLFPVLLKAGDGPAAARRSGRKMVVARDAAELLAAWDAMADPGVADLMLQEYLPGGDDSVWMFNGYFDRDGECRFGLTGRKLHQHPVGLGLTALGVLERNDAVHELTLRFMRAVGYRGVLDIGFRWDARDRQYKVLDVNPRLGATFRLFVDCEGLDVLRAEYLDATGQRFAPAPAPEGRRWLVEDLDLASGLRYCRAGELRPSKWLRQLFGVREAAWFAADDPLPFLGMCRRLAAEAGRRARAFEQELPRLGAAPATELQ